MNNACKREPEGLAWSVLCYHSLEMITLSVKTIAFVTCCLDLGRTFMADARPFSFYWHSSSSVDLLVPGIVRRDMKHVYESHT